MPGRPPHRLIEPIAAARPRDRKELLLLACELDRRTFSALARTPASKARMAASFARRLPIPMLLPLVRLILPRKLRWAAFALESLTRLWR